MDSNWIHISDKDPPKGEEVLGYDSWYEQPWIAIWDGDRDEDDLPRLRPARKDEDDLFITWWLPLPEEGPDGQ